MKAIEKMRAIESLADSEQKAFESVVYGMTSLAREYHKRFQSEFNEIEKSIESKGITKASCKTLDDILHQAITKAAERASVATGKSINAVYSAMKNL